MLLTIIFCSFFSMASDKPPDKSNQLEQKLSDKHPSPSAQVHRVLIYKDSDCKGCDEVHDQLKKHNIEYHDIDLAWNRKQRMILERKAGKKDISYVFIGNKYIGNHDDLMLILKQGKLHGMLQEE